jgi:hypothetical protein
MLIMMRTDAASRDHHNEFALHFMRFESGILPT